MVILLNGTSSSGKTSIVKELRSLLPKEYFYFGVDDFLQSALSDQINFENEADFSIVLKAISGFNRSLRSLAETVDNFVVDVVLDKDEWLHEVAYALDGFQTFFVGIRAPLETVEARERKRFNRKPGTARAQYEKINSLTYDLVIDTSKFSSFSAAEIIRQSLKPGEALSRYLS